MTKDDVIRMAREAGFPIERDDEGEYIGCWDFLNQEEALERFAALVAAHEREQCAETVFSETTEIHEEQDMVLKEIIADAIRARGQ